MKKMLLMCLFGTLYASQPPKRQLPSLRDLAIASMANIVVEKSVESAQKVFNEPINSKNFCSEFKKKLRQRLPRILHSDILSCLKFYCAEEIINKLNTEIYSLDYNNVDQKRKSLLHYCADQKKEWYVQLLLELGVVSVDQADYRGNTALHYAVSQIHKPTINVLLDYGASPKFCNRMDESPVVIAIKHNTLQILQLLIEKDRSLATHTDVYRYGMLHYVAFYHTCSASEFLPYLLSLGLDINRKAIDGDTPLHVATIKKRTAVVKLLLENGAKKTIRDNEGKLPLYYTKEGDDCEKLLQVSTIQKAKARCLRLFTST